MQNVFYVLKTIKRRYILPGKFVAILATIGKRVNMFQLPL